LSWPDLIPSGEKIMYNANNNKINLDLKPDKSYTGFLKNME
jgi:hypothetical protein